MGAGVRPALSSTTAAAVAAFGGIRLTMVEEALF